MKKTASSSPVRWRLFFCGWLLIAVLLISGEERVLGSTNFITRYWLPENGLPQNKVMAVAQTRDGYLWVGTYNGLARFDGVRFECYDSANTPELTDSRITSLFEGNDGRLWIGHETGEVTSYAAGRFTAVPVRARWTKKKIQCIGADESGDVWLLNDDGLLARVRDGRVLVPETGAEASLVEMTRSANGTIWVGRNGRVSVLQQGGLTPLSFPAGSTNTLVSAICASRDGGLWLQADGELQKWQDGVMTNSRGAAPFGDAPLLTLAETRDGTLVGGTSGQGLALVSLDESALIFCRTNGFSCDWVVAFCEDYEGNFWVGTGGGGLAMIRKSSLRTIAPQDGWRGRAVLSMCANHEDTLWIGTEGAGVYRYQDGGWTNFSTDAGLANAYIWSLAEDAVGNLWAGSWGGGLFLWRDEQFIRAPELENLFTPIPALCASHQGGLWMGTTEGLLDQTGKKIWPKPDPNGVLPKCDVRCILEGRAGMVWFGTSGEGLFRLQGGTWKQFCRADGLPGNFVQCLREDEDGALWIGTSDGLGRLQDDHFTVISMKQGLPDNVICDIEDDGRGFFWMSSFGGIFRVSRSELQRCAEGKTASVRCLTLGIGDGMPTLQASSGGCRTAAGNLWFATSRGLVEIDPQAVKTDLPPPPVLIENLLVDNQIASAPVAGARLKISPGLHRFEFQYTGLSFAAPEKVLFKHKLEGMDTDWVAAGTHRSADYNYLPPGDYTFRVTACNNAGVWNEAGASLAFSVLPFFWQTAWFRTLTLAGIILLVGVGAWYGTRRRMKLKLERLERQRAVERERTRIAKDIHDDLGASLTRINLLSQTARRSMDDVPQTEKNLERICTTARQLTRAMDEIVWAVDPQHDTLDSLANYLGKLIHEALSDSDIRCRLDFPLHLPAWPLTAEFRHNLFLAFKEALHNIVKHSGATEVQVAFAFEPSAFTLKVADNGCGFDAATPTDPALVNGQLRPRRNGLANMRQRLQEIGGRCEIQSERGRGTQIVFFLPVNLPVK